ncbi:60S ribosomal protein L17 [Binucleata daphniae]
MTNYSYHANDASQSVRASVKDARVSFKNTRETSRVLRGKKIQEAINYLQNVINHKQCVPMRRYARGCGRTKQAKEFKTTRGRWPEKSCNLFIYLLNNMIANADLKKLDISNLVLTHVQVNKAPKIYGRLHRAHGRVNSYNSSPCHVELVAEKEIVQIDDGEKRIEEIQ